METQEKIALLEKSGEFKQYKKESKDSFLVHVFRMLDEQNKDIWQFGYYNPDDTITTFILDKEDIKKIPEEAIFKDSERKLKALDISKIKLDFGDALKKAIEIHKKKYNQHPIMKQILILQSLTDGQVYNITFVTQTFHTLNVHVDASTGKIKREGLVSLMDIAKFEKGEGKKQDINYIG